MTNTMTQKIRIAMLKSLADETRISLVNALLEGPQCVEELAARLRRAPSTISFHLRKLEEGGLLSKTKTQYYLMYELRPDALTVTVKDLVTMPGQEESPEFRRMDRYRTKILRTFIRNGELVQLPKQWKKRLVILEEFLKKFEPGKEYEENEVNERIKILFPDYCTIRRLLIEEGYMTRSGTTYKCLEKGEKPWPSQAK